MDVISVWYYSDEVINDNICTCTMTVWKIPKTAQEELQKDIYSKNVRRMMFYLKKKFYIHQIRIQQYFPIV